MATYDIGIIVTALQRGVRATFNDIDRSLQRTERQAQRTTNRLRAIQVVLAGIATGAGIQFARSVAQTAGQFQLMEARLAAVEGGLQNARRTYADILETFKSSPFALNAIIDGFTRLRAAGLSTADAKETLEATQDAVAAFGGSTAELNRATVALQQIAGKGVLSMEELRQQLGEAVPSATRILARELGLSIPELFQKIEDGAIGAREAIQAFTRGAKEDFGGFAQELANTIPGAIAQLQKTTTDAIGRLFEIDTDAGQQTVDFIKRIEEAVQDFINTTTQGDIDAFFKALNSGATIGENLARSLKNIVIALGELAGGFLSIASQLPGGLQAVLTSGLIGAMMLGAPGAAVGAALAAVVEIGRAIGETSATVKGILTNLGAAAGFGLLGYLILGPLGAGVASAIGYVITDVARFLKQSFSDIFTDRGDLEAALIRGAKKNGVEGAKQFLDGYEAELKNRGTTVLGSIYSAIGLDTRTAIMKEIEILRKELDDANSRVTQEIVKNEGTKRKAIEETQDLISKQIIDVSQDLNKLLQRAQTTTFTFGSQTSARMEQQLQPMIEAVERFGQAVRVAEEDAAMGVIPPEGIKNIEVAQKTLAGLLQVILQIQAAISSGVGAGTAKFAGRVADQAERAEAAFLNYKAAVTDNEAQAAMLRTEARAKGIRTQLEKTLENQMRLNDTDGIAKTKALLGQVNGLRDIELSKTRAIGGIQSKILATEQQRQRIAIEMDQLRLAREQRGGLLQSFTSQFQDQAEDRRLTLQQGILSTQEEINRLEQDAVRATGERRQQIELTIERLREYQSAQQAALESTSAAGLLAQQTWKTVGDAIQDSVKGALRDLVKGTFDAEKALLAFYDKITDAAIDYLFELIKIQFRQQIISSFSPGGGAGSGFGLLSFVGGLFANGGAFKGQIQPFAEGGIVRGPTMFGLAGEAGDEAIMPLERIGGKLGVRATGAEGGNYNITIQAIDTQSGAQFIQKNAQSIINQLRSADRLNNYRTVR